MMRGKSPHPGYRKTAITQRKNVVTKLRILFVDNPLKNFVIKFEVSSFKYVPRSLKKRKK